MHGGDAAQVSAGTSEETLSRDGERRRKRLHEKQPKSESVQLLYAAVSASFPCHVNS